MKNFYLNFFIQSNNVVRYWVILRVFTHKRLDLIVKCIYCTSLYCASKWQWFSS